jgi:hypothetical protein
VVERLTSCVDGCVDVGETRIGYARNGFLVLGETTTMVRSDDDAIHLPPT